MKPKIIFILTICLIGSTVVSCFYGPCDPVPDYFEINSIESIHTYYDESRFPNFVQLENNSTVKWSNLITRFEFEVDYIASQPIKTGSELMAKSCESPGNRGSKIGVDSIIVRTVFDYNEKYQAGDIINNMVSVLDEYPQTISLDKYILENSNHIEYEIFKLVLTEAPDDYVTFKYNITYILKNGEEFQHQTETINLIW